MRKAVLLGGFSFLFFSMMTSCKSHDLEDRVTRPFSIPEWAVSLKSQVTSSAEIDAFEQVYVFPPLEIDTEGSPLKSPQLLTESNHRDFYVDDERSKSLRDQLVTGLGRRFKVLSYDEYVETKDPVLVCSFYYSGNISKADHYTCFLRMELSIFKGMNAEEKVLKHEQQLMAIFNPKKSTQKAYKSLLEHFLYSIGKNGTLEDILPWSEISEVIYR